MASVLVHDPFGNGKSQSGSGRGPVFIRPEEAFEDMGKLCPAYALTSVLDLQIGLSPVMTFCLFRAVLPASPLARKRSCSTR